MKLTELDRFRNEMIESKNKFDSSFNEYALKNCGNVFGDIVEVTGYAHKGKKMRFSSISAKYDNLHKEYFAVMHGHVLKNDGSEGKNMGKRYVSLGRIKKDN